MVAFCYICVCWLLCVFDLVCVSLAVLGWLMGWVLCCLVGFGELVNSRSDF